MTTPRGPESTVVRMVANAMHIQNIEVETGWTPDEIKAVALRNGYALDAASKRFRRAPQPKPVPVGIVRTSIQSEAEASLALDGDTQPVSTGPIREKDVLTLIERGLELPDIEDITGWDSDDISGLAASNGFTFNLDTFRFEDRRVRPTVTAVVAAPAPGPLPPVSDRPDVQAAWLAFFSAFTELLHAIDGKAPALPAPDMPTKRPGNYPTGPRLTHGASQSQIRDWARAQGLDVNPRGTVRRDIADAYAAAHPQETP